MATLQDQLAALQLQLTNIQQQLEIQVQGHAPAAAHPPTDHPPQLEPEPVHPIQFIPAAQPALPPTTSVANNTHPTHASPLLNPSQINKKSQQHPAKWRASSPKKVIGWTREKGCKNPLRYGVAVNSSGVQENPPNPTKTDQTGFPNRENCEVLQKLGQAFPKGSDSKDEGDGSVVEEGEKKKRKRRKKKEPLVLEGGKVFWYSRFERRGDEGDGKWW